MTKRKKPLILLFLLTMLICMNAKAQTLVLHHPDGTTTDVELYAQPRIEFQGDHVLITSTVLDLEFSKQDILRFTYNSGITLGIRNSKEKVNYSQENGQLVFSGIKSTEHIAVYNSKGIRVPVRITHNGSDATLSLNAIPKGVYLLSVNGRTSKFAKQ